MDGSLGKDDRSHRWYGDGRQKLRVKKVICLKIGFGFGEEFREVVHRRSSSQ